MGWRPFIDLGPKLKRPNLSALFMQRFMTLAMCFSQCSPLVCQIVSYSVTVEHKPFPNPKKFLTHLKDPHTFEQKHIMTHMGSIQNAVFWSWASPTLPRLVSPTTGKPRMARLHPSQIFIDCCLDLRQANAPQEGSSGIGHGFFTFRLHGQFMDFHCNLNKRSSANAFAL